MYLNGLYTHCHHTAITTGLVGSIFHLPVSIFCTLPDEFIDSIQLPERIERSNCVSGSVGKLSESSDACGDRVCGMADEKAEYDE